MGFAFISYSSVQEPSAIALRDILNANGILTWRDHDNIPPGGDFLTEVTQGVKRCSCLVLLLTYESMAAPWVEKEVVLAVHYKKEVIPIQLGDVVLTDKFFALLSTNQIVTVDSLDAGSPEIRNVVSTVARFVSADPGVMPNVQLSAIPSPVFGMSGVFHQNPFAGTDAPLSTQAQAYTQSSFPASGAGYPGAGAYANPVYIPSFSPAGQQQYSQPGSTSAGMPVIPSGSTEATAGTAQADDDDSSSRGLPGFLLRKRDSTGAAKPSAEKDRTEEQVSSSQSRETSSFMKLDKNPSRPGKAAAGNTAGHSGGPSADSAGSENSVIRDDPAAALKLDDLIREIINVEFNLEQGGYLRDQVDNYLDSLCDYLSGSDLTVRQLKTIQAKVSGKVFDREYRGYSISQVHAFLSALALKLGDLLS